MLVLIEKPFVPMLYDCMHYIRCAHCHVERTFTLILCEGCFSTVYSRASEDDANFAPRRLKFDREWWMEGREVATGAGKVYQRLGAH
uniref:Uncharacterized protein n=1 Tax=Anopheles stephensi TaxID=30069 RepID=A0A182YE93_ANOST